jgi:hypothetical protein
MEFVNSTGVMDEFAKLPQSKVAKTRSIMGMCETIGDNTSLAVVKRGLKVAENEVLFYKYGLLLRTHQKAMEAFLIRQRAEQVRRSEVDSQGRLGRWS